jgi:DNA-binding GntR family transcriptional regulator
MPIYETTQKKPEALRLIKRTSLRETVFDAIKTAAIRGELRPGQTLTELGLARRLGVAQATVREALVELAARGFVQRRNRRTCVAALSKSEIEAIYALRIPLEKMAVEWTARRPERDLEGLEKAYLRMRETAQGSDRTVFEEADLAFHMELWAAAGNRYLLEVLEKLVTPLFAFAIIRINQYHPRRQKLDEITNLHGKILAAVQARDEEAAKEALVASMDLAWIDGLPEP